MAPFKQLPVKLIPDTLPNIKRQIQLGKKRIAATNMGDVVGFFVQLEDVDPSSFEAMGKIALPTMCKRFYREKLWKQMAKYDACAITYHTRPIFWFVPPDNSYLLPLDVAPCSRKLLEETWELEADDEAV